MEVVVRGPELQAESGWLLNLDALGAALAECLGELDASFRVRMSDGSSRVFQSP